MITIYHNPRCSKSRQGVALLEDKAQNFEIVKYLDEPLTKSQLQEIISKLGIQPIELVRKNEAIWKTDYKSKTLSDEAIVEAMVTHPKLIERPIIVNGDKAVIGRPAENILTLI